MCYNSVFACFVSLNILTTELIRMKGYSNFDIISFLNISQYYNFLFIIVFTAAPEEKFVIYNNKNNLKIFTFKKEFNQKRMF